MDASEASAKGCGLDVGALGIAGTARAYRTGRLSPVEVTAACLDRIRARDGRVHAFVTITDDLALRQARTAERALRSGRGVRQTLLGIPIVLKDLIETAGIRTTASSDVLAESVPERDATVWRRLRAAGAVLLGKVHTHEFAYGSSTPPTRNPWDVRRIPGGSSGGSAAALAAGMCLGAVGTDTAGSIRIPAGLCGVVGLKPTSGLIGRTGVIPLSSTLDHVGPMARSAADAAVLLHGMRGTDSADPASVRPPRGWTAAVPARPVVRGLRVGVISNTGAATTGALAALAAAGDALAVAGAHLDEVTIAGWEDAVWANFTIIGVEAAAYHEPWLRTVADKYTPSVRARLEAGFAISGVAYHRALQAAGTYRQCFATALERRDLLLCAGMPAPAPRAYVDEFRLCGRAVPVDPTLCRNTAVSNMTGLPALALPAGFEGGLPVGVQLIGRRFSERTLLTAGELLLRRLAVPTLAP